MFSRIGIFKISDNKTPRKRKVLDFLIAFGLCTLALTIVFCFILIVKIPSKMLLEPKEIYGETSNPTVARLVLTCIDFPIIIACLFFAIKFDKLDKTFITLFFAYMGGTFLWQMVGECLWHFGFFRIEVGPALPFAIIAAALLIYCYKKNAFSWPILVFVIAFMSNWLGHLVELAPAGLLIDVMKPKTAYIIFGFIFGGSFLLHSLYIYIFDAINQKGRALSTMGIFISFCVIMFAFLES